VDGSHNTETSDSLSLEIQVVSSYHCGPRSRRLRGTQRETPQPGVESSVACHVAARIYQGRDVTGIEPMTILVFLVQRKRLGLVVTETGMCLCGERQREKETRAGKSMAGERERERREEVFHHTTVTISSAFSTPPPECALLPPANAFS
jgi:hypothetical protein